jgi:hypothetical protein
MWRNAAFANAPVPAIWDRPGTVFGGRGFWGREEVRGWSQTAELSSGNLDGMYEDPGVRVVEMPSGGRDVGAVLGMRVTLSGVGYGRGQATYFATSLTLGGGL